MLRLKSILQYSNIVLYLFFIILILSFIRCSIPRIPKYNLSDNKIEGIILDIKKDDDKYSFVIKGKEKVKCNYYTDEELNIRLGDKVLLVGELKEPSNNTLPNTFNYKKYLYNNYINYTMTVKSLDVIHSNSNIFYSIKNTLIEYINTFSSKGYLSTFITGDKSLLGDGVYETYQELGVSHIFAISGMHVSILSMIILKIFSKYKHRYKVVISFLLFYMFITNFSPSIVRSVVFFILLHINKEYDFYLDNIKIFYLTITIILIVNPFFIYNIGFLYSSVISYSLIKYSEHIKGNKIITLLKISIFSMLVSLPITINSNYELNILSVFNNLLFVPLISLIIYPLSLITLIIKPLDGVFLFLMNIVEEISKHALVFKVIIPKMNIFIIIIYYLILYVFINTYNKKYLLLIGLSLVMYKYLYLLDQSYYVNYIDVGQGDSSIIRYKGNVTLIDTGGKVSDSKTKHYYTDNTIKYIKSLGVDKISTLILTHGDFDHMGEAINLVNNFKVEKVILNCGPYNDLEKELIEVLDKKKIKYYSCIKELNIDNNKLYFLQTKEYDNENDNSNVIYTEINGYKFMFMGDASSTTEKEIMNKYNLPNIDVLKVGHHGSRTGSSIEFINEINPKYSIISVGKNNRYGHPNKEVLENLNKSKIYRTDIDGSIMFKIENNKLQIEMCNP